MLRVEPARLSDAEAITALVDVWADKDQMLHRPLAEIYENIRDFQVARDEAGELIGCGGLHVLDSDLAEIRALAVSEHVQGTGAGAAVVEACVADAKRLGIARVFALTYQAGFFERQGFHVANVMDFPQKVWSECVRCPFFTNCKEIAVVREL
jgi:amino-acid N-acetyltransferase